ncbi:MAG: hypothetical protein ACI3ZS_09755 [Candidatus Cryptobacteroides sp.]
MKTMYKFMMAASALLLVACAKENAPVSDAPEGLILTALVEEYPVTRTGVSDGKVFWNSGDAIAVSNGSAVAEFTTADPDGSASASFTTSSDTFAKAETYSALYPYAEGTVFADGKVNAEVPAIQAPVAGSFDDGVNVAVAQGVGNALSFKNVCGYFKFTVPAGMTDLTKVEIVANGGEKLSGRISVNVADASYTLTSEGKSSVSLEGTFEARKSYYLAVLPQELSAGFTVRMTRGSEVSEMAASKSITVTRSASFNFGELYDGNWKVNLSGSAVPSGKTLWLTKTLENDNLFACLEELEAGTLNLKALHEDFYVAVAGGTFTDGEAVAYTTSSSPCDITIPSAGKYRIVLDKAASKITFYSSATDTPNKKVSYNNTVDKINPFEQEVTALWMYGTFNGLKMDAGSQFENKYKMTQSLANPYLFVWYDNGNPLPRFTKVFQKDWDNKEYTGGVTFFVSNIQNNVYAYGSTAQAKRGSKTGAVECVLGEKADAVAGQSDNRYALFLIPENANYVEVDIDKLTVLFDQR